MTPAQLDVARAHRGYHAEKFGHAAPNTEFHHGYIEKLHELDLEPGSFDIIVSNCVINLATDKAAVLKGAFDLLKPGGEMYFSDVYADRRVPAAMAEDEVLYGECLSGALYWNDSCGWHAGRVSPIRAWWKAVCCRWTTRCLRRGWLR